MKDRYCFLDKERLCAEECVAFNRKTTTCKFLERSATLSRSFRVLMSWLGQHDPPKVR
jgi:hypothetical protein